MVREELEEIQKKYGEKRRTLLLEEIDRRWEDLEAEDDPNAEQVLSVETHHMNVDYNAYEGKKIKGVVETVLSRGKVVVDNGDFKGKAGDGQFLKRGTCVAI